MTLALEKIRVLDMTQVMAGPFCTMMLADLGADVIKVEPVGSGDSARRSFGPRMKGEDTAAFLAVNRNKRGIALDLKTEEGRELLRRMVEDADVLVENYRPGVTKKLGVDYESLSQLNPRLIYASISGFGQNGPYASRPGYDLIAQGMSGLMSVTGEPGGGPVKSGIPVTDLGAGLFCAIAVLSAYIARGVTGRGQYIDTSLFEAGVGLSVWETTELWATGNVPRPLGSAHRLSAPYQALRTRDGYLTIGGNNQRLWQRLCQVIEREELVADERFADNDARMAHRDELVCELEASLAGRDTVEWVEAFLEAGVPAGPLMDYGQVVEDPHTLAREMVAQVEHPVEGLMKTLGIPMKLSDTPGSVRRPAPLLGEHTAELLAELGLSEARVAELREKGVVA
jgi:crotonobetainyl-CoA:carnitine CoA-transferase CaiB-like acyl-CoA transferase